MAMADEPGRTALRSELPSTLSRFHLGFVKFIAAQYNLYAPHFLSAPQAFLLFSRRHSACATLTGDHKTERDDECDLWQRVVGGKRVKLLNLRGNTFDFAVENCRSR